MFTYDSILRANRGFEGSTWLGRSRLRRISICRNRRGIWVTAISYSVGLWCSRQKRDPFSAMFMNGNHSTEQEEPHASQKSHQQSWIHTHAVSQSAFAHTEEEEAINTDFVSVSIHHLLPVSIPTMHAFVFSWLEIEFVLNPPFHHCFAVRHRIPKAALQRGLESSESDLSTYCPYYFPTNSSM